MQDGHLATTAKVSKNEIDWAKMTLLGQGSNADGESQIDSSSVGKSTLPSHSLISQGNMAQIDLMLYRFIEHRQLFEFIEVFKVYLKDKSKEQESADNLNGKTFLHIAIEHSASQIASYLLLDAKVDPNVLSHNS